MIQGEPVFKGQAKVTYSTKDEAALALQKLPFELELGENVDPDLFVTIQGRLKEYEIKNNPLR